MLSSILSSLATTSPLKRFSSVSESKSPQGRLILTLISTDLLEDSPITADLSAIIVSGNDKTKYSFALGVSDVISVTLPQQSGILNQFN